jgi:hypothetical protein
MLMGVKNGIHMTDVHAFAVLTQLASKRSEPGVTGYGAGKSVIEQVAAAPRFLEPDTTAVPSALEKRDEA